MPNRRTRSATAKSPLSQMSLPRHDTHSLRLPPLFLIGKKARCGVPAELLREIMLLSVAGETGLLDRRKPPLLLREVSPAWKAHADSIQDLWTTISVTAPYFNRQNLKVVRDWLSRSGSTKPLNITLSPPTPDTDLHLLHDFQALLLTTSRRWAQLNLLVPTRTLPFMLSNPNAPLPALEALSLTLESQPHLVLSPTATRLRTVCLTVFPGLTTPSPIFCNLNWQQITQLDLRTVLGTVDFVWDVLVYCPNLRGLQITAMANINPPSAPFNPIRRLSLKLEHLSMYVNARPGYIGYFLDGLHLPRLHSLTLVFAPNRIREETVWPLEAILALYDVSLPPLTNFFLYGKAVSERRLIELVSRIRRLRELIVCDGTFDYVTDPVKILLPRDEIDFAYRVAEWQREKKAAEGSRRT